jgi:hypothetical protein
VPIESASVFRQAKENTSRSGLNAIALARQVALLILTVHDIHPPDGPVTNDFYRQALDLDLRGKREYTADILAAMGGVSKARLWHFKSLLQLSDEAMELADRESIDEYKLRPILSLHPDYHYEIVRQIVDFDLTGKQIRELCHGAFDEDISEAEPRLPRYAIRAAQIVLNPKVGEIEEIVSALMAEETDIEVIKLRWRNYVQMVETYFAEN